MWGGATASAQFEGGYNKNSRGKSHLDFVDFIASEKRNNKHSTDSLTYERYLENKKNEKTSVENMIYARSSRKICQ